jgi:hypothetical protein
MSKWTRLFLLIPLIPTAIYVLSLLFYPNRDLLILWSREFNVPFEAIAPLVVTVAAYCTLAVLFARRVQSDQGLSRTQRLGLIGLVIAGGLAIQLSVTRLSEVDPLAGIAWRTYAIKTNGYWTVGAQAQDVARFIGEYAQHAAEYPVHESRHPPGLSLIFWAGAQLFRLVPALATPVADWLRPYSCLSSISVMVPDNQMAAGAFGALLEITLAMLTTLPLYALVKRLAGARAAVWSVLLYSLTPGFGMWVTQWDRSFALFTATVLFLCEDIVQRNSYSKAFLAGLLLSCATFASFGNLPIGVFAAIYALVRIFQTQPRAALRILSTWRPRILQAGLVLLGAGVLWALAFAFFGLNPVTLYRVIMQSHLAIDFPYWPFVAWHPWDIMTFVGLPLVAITLFAGWRRAAPLAAAFCITLFVLSILGVARAETGRVWLFFTPLAVGAAAIVLVRRRSGEQAAVVAMLAVQLVVQAGMMRPMTNYGIKPADMPAATVPAGATLIDTRFGANGQIALLGYTLGDLRPGDTTNMTLYWQRMSPAPIDTAYKVFIHLATDQSDQARILAQDAEPVDWLYPTTCWQPNQIIADVHPLEVPADVSPGSYPIFVGLYDPVQKVRPPTFASPPTVQMYGSLLLPTQATVVPRR